MVHVTSGITIITMLKICSIRVCKSNQLSIIFEYGSTRSFLESLSIHRQKKHLPGVDRTPSEKCKRDLHCADRVWFVTKG